MLKKTGIRIIFEITFGFLLSIIINSIVIFIAYARLYSQKLGEMEASIFGLKIFKISNYGDSGIPNVNNMMLFGAIFMLLFVAVLEFVRMRRKL